MASTTVVENISAKVEEVSKKGKEGNYKAKVVKVNGKEWTVSKNDVDKVRVGEDYNFKLSKSEYNDKLYYWANLVKTDSSAESDKDGDEFKQKVFSWLKNLNHEEKKKVIIYLIDKMKE